jgi:hypothetical protein
MAERRKEHSIGNPRLIGHAVHTPEGLARLVDISNRQACVRLLDSDALRVYPEGEVYAS